MQKYQITFLSKKEMDSIHYAFPRYEHVDGENLGFADKKNNRVFVRSGLDAELTKYLINHEVEHLFEEKGTHEDEHGIRHKKGGFFKNLFDPIGVFHNGNILGVGGKQGITSSILGGGDSGAGLLGKFFGGGDQSLLGNGGGMNSIFPTSNFASSTPGFGQTSASAPSGAGQFSGAAPLTNVGLSAGIPNSGTGQQAGAAQTNQNNGYYYF